MWLVSDNCEGVIINRLESQHGEWGSRIKKKQNVLRKTWHVVCPLTLLFYNTYMTVRWRTTTKASFTLNYFPEFLIDFFCHVFLHLFLYNIHVLLESLTGTHSCCRWVTFYWYYMMSYFCAQRYFSERLLILVELFL